MYSIPWHVLWTYTHCEQQVHDQLVGKGFELFLPLVERWQRRNGIRHHVTAPMFPGYLFIHHLVDRLSYREIVASRGLVRILGEAWDQLAVVPDKELESIRKVHEAKVPVVPHEHLRQGQRVRITAGLLVGVEGILLRQNSSRGILVLSVDMLQRSVAVEVDCTAVEPA